MEFIEVTYTKKNGDTVRISIPIAGVEEEDVSVGIPGYKEPPPPVEVEEVPPPPVEVEEVPPPPVEVEEVPPPPVEVEEVPPPPVDAEGVPWNPEFHSANKTKTKAGLWRKRKGVDEVPPPPPVDEVPPPPPDMVPPRAPKELLSGDCPADFVGLARALKEDGLGLKEMNGLAEEVGAEGFYQIAAQLDLIPKVWEVYCASK